MNQEVANISVATLILICTIRSAMPVTEQFFRGEHKIQSVSSSFVALWPDPSFASAPIMYKAKCVQRQIHMYIHTCWVGTWLTTAEQRAGPPITEHRACGLAPLVRVSAAPCPPSQKQGNGLCYSLLLTLQQTWGWVQPTPTSLSLFCMSVHFCLSSFWMSRNLLSILSVLSPDVWQISSLKPLQQ